ncbi:MAG: site-2 protease family protein [Acidobacteriaceae bacterium]|nr:site-2 protease family protein [Acidobacteriaceae bacterium]
MAAYSSPHGIYCPNCGSSIDSDALICPNCKRFTHATELDNLATRARQLVAMGQLQAAREHWVAALNLLPSESSQRRAVEREIRKIDDRLSPPSKKDWTKRLGPLGVALAAIIKYKTVLLVLLTKSKLIISAFAFLAVYWALYGWWFAVGITGSVFLHEMGHYLMARRFGFAAELPMFLPGLGAYVKWQGAGVDPNVRAQISLAGPFFGFLSGLIAYGIFLSNGKPIWLAIAQIAGWINLLNLIPVFIFDGASAMTALGRQARIAVLVVSIAMFFVLQEFLCIFVAIATGFRLYKRDFPANPKQGVAYAFIALVIANGFLSWFALSQARLLFPR